MKEYLAAKLHEYVTSCNDLTKRTAALEAENSRLLQSEMHSRHETENIKRDFLTHKDTVSAQHAKEIASMKEQHTQAIGDQHRALTDEHKATHAQLTDEINRHVWTALGCCLVS